MVNESARKSGLPINNTTLLNYMNKSSSTTGNSLLNALNSTKTVSSAQKNSYEQLEKSANALENAALVFTSEEDDNIFSQAREDGDTASVKKQAKEFISSYNEMMKKLVGSTSSLNSYYKQMLEEACSENSDSLSSIGITADRNGYLSMDESKFDAADVDSLENALGNVSDFSTKAGFIASRVANNAQTNLESISSQYSSAGKNYSSYTVNKYDFLG
jgi:hypothetical protein